MVKKAKKNKYIRVCPKCGSIKINIFLESKIHTIGILPTEYRCSDCGYIGKFFLEVQESELEKHRKFLKKGKLQ